MNSRDVFGIIIRTFGLCLVLYAVWFFFSATVIHFNLTKAGETEAFEFFAVGTLFLGVGLYLLRGAPEIMGFSYPEPQASENSEEETREYGTGEGDSTGIPQETD